MDESGISELGDYVKIRFGQSGRTGNEAEQFIRIQVKLMEQLRRGAEWSDEEILERIDLLVSETARTA